MNISAHIKHIDGKELPWYQLALFFGEKSLYGLIKTLRHYSRAGYLRYEVALIQEYYDEQQAKQDVLLHTHVLKPFDPFGALRGSSHPLTFSQATVLSEKQVEEVVQKLPRDIADQYLRFTIKLIDADKLVKLVNELIGGGALEEDAFYPPVAYRGLEIVGPVISFNKKPFNMGVHHREAMRIFIEKRGGTCTYEDFKDGDVGVFTKAVSEYSNINHTIRGLIYDLRTELLLATGRRLIENSSGGGWFLDIEP